MAHALVYRKPSKQFIRNFSYGPYIKAPSAPDALPFPREHFLAPILNNFTPLDHERFAAHRELEARLKAALRGDVLFDLGSRALYATDASNYRQLPIGVVLPRDAADVEAALAACRAIGRSRAAARRGNQPRRPMRQRRRSLRFFALHERAYARSIPTRSSRPSQPGIVLDRLRDAAELHHLTYAPDPATHSRCTLGGMIGNNSCGVHGLLGGKTVPTTSSRSTSCSTTARA